MTDWVKYEIPKVTIDGEYIPDGTEVALKVLATVAEVDDRRVLHIKDWAGPWPESADPGPEPKPVPREILERCVAAFDVAWKNLDDSEGFECDADWMRPVVEAALMQLARMLPVIDDEATQMILGVYKLDVEKLTKTGDAMATMLRGMREEDLVGDGALDLIARWKGQAHGDWADDVARRRVT